MGTPHKHAELIKAWADGDEIQYLDIRGNWVQAITPSWNPDLKYRIKPKTIRYRVALLKFDNNFVPNAIEDPNYNTCHQYFVRWLSDWIEVEV